MLQVLRDGAKIEFGRKSESAHGMLGLEQNTGKIDFDSAVTGMEMKDGR
jgi:hypothetical protein